LCLPHTFLSFKCFHIPCSQLYWSVTPLSPLSCLLSSVFLFQIVIKKKLLSRGAVTALVRIAARDYQSEEKAWVGPKKRTRRRKKPPPLPAQKQQQQQQVVEEQKNHLLKVDEAVDQQKQQHAKKRLKQKVVFQPIEAAPAVVHPRVAMSAPVSPVAKAPAPLPPPVAPAPPPPPTVAPPAWDAKHDGQLRAAAVGLEALTLTIVVPFEGYVATCQALCNALFNNASRSFTPVTVASTAAGATSAGAPAGADKGSFSFDSGMRKLTSPVPPAKLQLVEGDRENWWRSPLAFGRTGPSGGCGFLLHCQVPTPRNLANRRSHSGPNSSNSHGNSNGGSGGGGSSTISLHSTATAASSSTAASTVANEDDKDIGPWNPGALCPLVITVHTAASARAWAVATAAWKDFRAANSPAQRAAAAARAHAAINTVPMPPGARDDLPVNPPLLSLRHQSSSFSPRRFGMRRSSHLQRSSSSSSSLQRSTCSVGGSNSFSHSPRTGAMTPGNALVKSNYSSDRPTARSVSKTTSALAAGASLLLSVGCAHWGTGVVISGMLLGAAAGALLRLLDFSLIPERLAAVAANVGRRMSNRVNDLSRRCTRGFKSDSQCFALLQRFRPAGVRYRRSVSRLRSRSTSSNGLRNGWALLRELHRRGLLQPSDGPQILREIAKHRAARAAEIARAEAAADAAYDPFADRVEELLLHGEKPATLSEIRDRAQKAYFRHRRLSSLQVQEAPEATATNAETGDNSNDAELDDDDAFVLRHVSSTVVAPFAAACMIIVLSSALSYFADYFS